MPTFFFIDLLTGAVWGIQGSSLHNLEKARIWGSTKEGRLHLLSPVLPCILEFPELQAALASKDRSFGPIVCRRD